MNDKIKIPLAIAVLSVAAATLYGMRFQIGLEKPDPFKEQRAKKEVYREAVANILAQMPAGDFKWLPYDEVQPYNQLQNVFKGATSTDVVLLFESAGKVIVYSPSRHKVVNVSPLVIYDPSQKAAQ